MKSIYLLIAVILLGTLCGCITTIHKYNVSVLNSPITITGEFNGLSTASAYGNDR
jgi:hypothetical protein